MGYRCGIVGRFRAYSKDYFRDEMNNPAMLELFGDIRGKRILDLGCGEGDNSRIMARKGAIVTGVDFSKKMIDFDKVHKIVIDKLIISYLIEGSDILINDLSEIEVGEKEPGHLYIKGKHKK